MTTVWAVAWEKRIGWTVFAGYQYVVLVLIYERSGQIMTQIAVPGSVGSVDNSRFVIVSSTRLLFVPSRYLATSTVSDSM